MLLLIIVIIRFALLTYSNVAHGIYYSNRIKKLFTYKHTSADGDHSATPHLGLLKWPTLFDRTVAIFT